MSQTFQRKKEDFVCEHCGVKVRGNGYTNHCPKCLWSKHVDVFPGDRAETCGGMMEPIGVEKKGTHFLIIQKCVSCGKLRNIKVSPDDDFDAVLKVVKQANRDK